MSASTGSDGLPTERYARLVGLMDRLRRECPWDREQTFETIAPYTIEEAYEVKDAIDRGDLNDLKGELGDLLFQVLFHARLAEEVGAFSLDDVADTLVEKMVRRHPHVFGDADAPDWDGIKASERAKDAQGKAVKLSALDGVALALPALMRAQKLQKRAAKTGFDWPSSDGAFEKIIEEAEELRRAPAADQQDEAGDLLFSVVNLIRKLGLDSETALRDANAKFTRRFAAMEERTEREDHIKAFSELSLDEMEALWQAAKKDGY